MKKILAACLLLATLLSLFACGGAPAQSEQLPEGMKIAERGDGYTFYVPEDWAVDRSTGIVTAYVSAVDPSSVTLVRVRTEATPAAYFEASLDDLRRTFTDFFMNPDLSSDEVTFGGKPAIVRQYSGKIGETPYGVKQYLCREGDYLYLLTYTAKEVIPSGEKTYFERYEETVGSMVSVFAFRGTQEPAVTTEAKPPVTNASGLVLLSDPAVSRFSLYVPKEWTPDLTNGTTSATRDGAVLTFSYEIPAEDNIEDYWKARNEQYKTLFENYQTVEAEWTVPVEKIEDVVCWLGGRQAVRRVFTFTRGGTAYKTTKLMTVDGIYIYTLTYTAAYTGDGNDTYTALYGDLEAVAEALTFQ